MICPECKAAGQKSRITPRGGGSTAMHFAPYWDEEGTYHCHDGNIRTASYSCSKGHHWTKRLARRPCPGCPWPKKVGE